MKINIYSVLIIILLVAIVLACIQKKPKESNYKTYGGTPDPFEEKPECPTGEIYNESLPGCVAQESAFGHGGGFFHGGRGRYWGGYGYPWGAPYYYDDQPVVVVNSTKCPKGWIWMGAMLGCEKPQGM